MILPFVVARVVAGVHSYPIVKANAWTCHKFHCKELLQVYYPPPAFWKSQFTNGSMKVFNSAAFYRPEVDR